MSGLASGIGGLLGLLGAGPGGSVPNLTPPPAVFNPFSPLDLTQFTGTDLPGSQPAQNVFGLTGADLPGSQPAAALPGFTGADLPGLNLSSITGADLGNIGLSPEQQALVDFTGGQQDIRTRDIYSRLGLGGSTMQAQDLGGNQLARLAQEAGLIQGNQQLAMQERGQGLTEQQIQQAGLLSERGQGLTLDQLLQSGALSERGQGLTLDQLLQSGAVSERGQALQEQQIVQGGTLNFETLLGNLTSQFNTQQLAAQSNAFNQGQSSLQNLVKGLGNIGTNLQSNLANIGGGGGGGSGGTGTFNTLGGGPG